MGRTATGVRGMRLADDTEVVSMIVAAEGDVLTATARGYGKRTALDEFPKKGRGTQGVIGIQCSERNGALVAAVQVTEAHELMLISNQGTLVRTRVAEVSQLSRNTQGVTLIKLPADEALVSVVRLEADEDNGAGRRRGLIQPVDAPRKPRRRPGFFVSGLVQPQRDAVRLSSQRLRA
jgi:DNA gyrase subunit A